MKRRQILACLTATCLCACVESPPRIGQGLPANFAEARTAFDQRVKERFPVGSSESALVTELRREHFRISPFSATREVSNFVCRLMYEVDWKAADGEITEVGGVFRPTCL